MPQREERGASASAGGGRGEGGRKGQRAGTQQLHRKNNNNDSGAAAEGRALGGAKGDGDPGNNMATAPAPADANNTDGAAGALCSSSPSSQQQQQQQPASVIAACIDRFRHAPAMPRGARQPPVKAEDFWWLQGVAAGSGAGGASDDGRLREGPYPDPNPLTAPMPLAAGAAGPWAAGRPRMASVDEGEEGQEQQQDDDDGMEDGGGGRSSSGLDARAEELLAKCQSVLASDAVLPFAPRAGAAAAAGAAAGAAGRASGGGDAMLEEALRLSKERPEEAVRRMRARLGLVEAAAGAGGVPEAAAPPTAMTMIGQGKPAAVVAAAGAAAGAAAAAPLSISMECIGATTPDAFPDFYRQHFYMEQRFLQQEEERAAAGAAAAAGAGQAARGKQQKKGGHPLLQGRAAPLTVRTGGGSGCGGSPVSPAGVGAGVGGGRSPPFPSTAGTTPAAGSPGSQQQSPLSLSLSPQSSGGLWGGASPPASPPPAVRVPFPQRAPPFPSALQYSQQSLQQAQQFPSSPPQTPLLVSRASSIGSTASFASSTSSCASNASNTSSVAASSSSWPPSAHSLAVVRALVNKVVHQSLFEPPAQAGGGTGGRLTPRACRVDRAAPMGVVAEEGGDAVLTALRAQEAALLRELERSR